MSRHPNLALVVTLKAIVGARYVLTTETAARRYCTGFRCGRGRALAVVRPRSLLEFWRVLQACTAEQAVVILQAANTGLTGGSTPAGEDYGRDVVLINTLRIKGIHVIDEGRQVICLAGATLYQLEAALKPWKREPHSVIGSSCIGASVTGGVCNNSGGALVRRGPAYTQMALFAHMDGNGTLHLVNHLGVRLGEGAETILERLDRGEFGPTDVEFDPKRWGSDRDYPRRVRDLQAIQPARFNADPARLFEASGSAGKVAVFAVRLDTFPQDEDTRVFYIGTNDPDQLAAIRRHMLTRFENLPVAAEYIHRTAFNIAETYGKDTFLAIRWLGTARLPQLLKVKTLLDTMAEKLGVRVPGPSDRLLQSLSRWLPLHLPIRMRSFRDRFEHHLIIRMAGAGNAEAAAYFKSLFPMPSGDFFHCTEEEAKGAFLHRFVVAGAAIRFRAVHFREVEDIVALDVALRPGDEAWVEELPESLSAQILHRLYYGHFFCHVFHQDYIVRKGCDSLTLEHEMWRLLDRRGAQYPAEHNVGHLYPATPALAQFYKALDPVNSFNPGIGQTSKLAHWKS
jgi:D-lactate dehydrogenase (quinone)